MNWLKQRMNGCAFSMCYVIMYYWLLCYFFLLTNTVFFSYFVCLCSGWRNYWELFSFQSYCWRFFLIYYWCTVNKCLWTMIAHCSNRVYWSVNAKNKVELEKPNFTILIYLHVLTSEPLEAIFGFESVDSYFKI